MIAQQPAYSKKFGVKMRKGRGKQNGCRQEAKSKGEWNMSFLLEGQEERLQERRVAGKYRKAAVSCWFTSKGRSIPQLVKYEDEEGRIRCIRQIRLLKAEEKYFAGIRMKRYDCCSQEDGIRRNFILLYHVEEGTWDLVLPCEEKENLVNCSE